MFILALIFAGIGVIALIVAASNAKSRVLASGETPNGSAFKRGTNVIISRAARWVAAGLFTLAAVFLVVSAFFRQDVGQANVLRDWTGAIVGYETSAGLHAKAPWVDVVTFDVRNQRAVFVSEQEPGQGDNVGGAPDGKCAAGSTCWPAESACVAEGGMQNTFYPATWSIVGGLNPSSSRDTCGSWQK